MAHAILSPSSASRWLACTPSARLEANYADNSGEAAAEGTDAHELAELTLQKLTGKVPKAQIDKRIMDFTKNSKYFGIEMKEYIDNYVSYVMERYNEARAKTPDAVILLEQQVDLREFVPDGFGTRDVAIVADKKLLMIDLKYGKGVRVSAEENKQLMVYALGTIREFDLLYDIEEIEMVIHQPRLDAISSYTISVDELLKWGDEFVKPKAALAFAGEGEYVAGDHCKFCKARNECRALADYMLDAVVADFADDVKADEYAPSNLLSPEEVTKVLQRADAIKSWLKGVEEFALATALDGSREWPGFKLVEGRSNRKITDHTKAVEALRGVGFSEAVLYKPKEMVSITELEKVVGKKQLTEVLGSLIVKPEGAPTLVPQSDKRAPLAAKATAADDFADDIEYLLGIVADSDTDTFFGKYWQIVTADKKDFYNILIGETRTVDIRGTEYTFGVHSNTKNCFVYEKRSGEVVYTCPDTENVTMSDVLDKAIEVCKAEPDFITLVAAAEKRLKKLKK